MKQKPKIIKSVHKLGEQELIRLCQEHPPQQDAWEEFFHRYHRQILKQVKSFRFKYRLFEEDPNDLIQDIWERVIKAIVNYDFHAKYEHFLKVVIHRGLIDYLRRRKNKVPIFYIEEKELEIIITQMTKHKTRSPTQIIEDDETFQRLMDLLNELPEEQRKVLFQYYIEGTSLPEVAKMLNKSTSYVYVLKHRGLKKLRELVEI